MQTAFVALLAYVFGGLLFGPIVARRAGVDLFAEGSGNPGATNVERLVGKRAALLVLLLDAGKGTLAVLAARATVPADAALVALAVVLGHCVPAFAPMRGGKGVATALGAIACLDPIAGLAFALGYVGARALTRYGSVGSLAGITIGAGVVIARGTSARAAMSLLALVAIVFVRHAANLVRLARGEEPKVASAPPDLDED